MFQQPRPLSQAPTTTAFTPSSAPLHVAAVPLSTPGREGAQNGSSGSRGPIAARHLSRVVPMVQRIQPAANPAAAAAQADGYSPAASPGLSHASSVFGPASTPSPEPFGAGGGVPPGGPSGGAIPPSFGFYGGSPRVDLYTPQSPMVSPMMSPSGGMALGTPALGGIGVGSVGTSGGGGDRIRRDSVDEEASAHAHLQNIMWRNVQPRPAMSLRAQVHARGMASPKAPEREVSGGSGGSNGNGGSGVPASPVMTSQAGSRAIPISKPRLAQSVMQQLQQADEQAQAGSGGAAGAASGTSLSGGGGSREGSRRSSYVSTATPLTGAASSPLGPSGASYTPVGTSLGTSYSVLSHTPPTRADNPLEHDKCFSPAQQAKYFKELQAAAAQSQQQQGQLVGQAFSPLLPMVHTPLVGPQAYPPHGFPTGATGAAQGHPHFTPLTPQARPLTGALAQSLLAQQQQRQMEYHVLTPSALQQQQQQQYPLQHSAPFAPRTLLSRYPPSPLASHSRVDPLSGAGAGGAVSNVPATATTQGQRERGDQGDQHTPPEEEVYPRSYPY